MNQEVILPLCEAIKLGQLFSLWESPKWLRQSSEPLVLCRQVPQPHKSNKTFLAQQGWSWLKE